MSVRLITLTIVGFILGAFAAGGVGVRVIREVRSVDDATSLPAQNIARSDGYHVDPDETLISSVALVPTAATIDEGGLVISYDLASLAPSLDVESFDPWPPLYAKRWLAEAIGGEFEGVQEDPLEANAVFPLMAGGTLDQIDTVTVTEAYLPVPFEQRLVITAGDHPEVSIAEGVAIELVDQVDDGTTTTITLRLSVDADAARSVSVVGDGPGWHPASIEGDTVILVRENAGNTDDSGGSADFGLVVAGTSWVPIDGDFTVDIGAFDE